MTENPEIPMDGSGPIEPVEPVKQIAEPAEEEVDCSRYRQRRACLCPCYCACSCRGRDGRRDEEACSGDDTAGEEASLGDSMDALGELSCAVHDDLEWTADLLERFG